MTDRRLDWVIIIGLVLIALGIIFGEAFIP
jgi:hypothetical protein